MKFTVTFHSCPGAVPAHFTQPNFFTPTPVIKLCPSSKGSLLHSLFHPQLIAHSAAFNWKFNTLTTPTYQSICKVLHYSEFLTQPPFLFKGFHLRFLTACAISVSSNTNGALQDAGQSVSDKSNFHQLLWLSLEPSSGSGQALLHHCGSCKRNPVAGVQNHFTGKIFTCLFHSSATPLQQQGHSFRTGSVPHGPIFTDTEDRDR